MGDIMDLVDELKDAVESHGMEIEWYPMGRTQVELDPVVAVSAGYFIMEKGGLPMGGVMLCLAEQRFGEIRILDFKETPIMEGSAAHLHLSIARRLPILQIDPLLRSGGRYDLIVLEGIHPIDLRSQTLLMSTESDLLKEYKWAFSWLLKRGPVVGVSVNPESRVLLKDAPDPLILIRGPVGSYTPARRGDLLAAEFGTRTFFVRIKGGVARVDATGGDLDEEDLANYLFGNGRLPPVLEAAQKALEKRARERVGDLVDLLNVYLPEIPTRMIAASPSLGLRDAFRTSPGG